MICSIEGTTGAMSLSSVVDGTEGKANKDDELS
jgi:hypothetical protein